MENALDLLASIIANPLHARHYRVLAELYKKQGRVKEYSALSFLIEKRFPKNDNDTDDNQA
tara:strand:+ start:8979 stop:9161 length:183 start_codon:yes stop_codon:yes gene_type:complete